MGKIRFINMQSVSPRALLAQIAEDEDVDAVVVIVRRNDQWCTTWSSPGIDTGSLCMASMTLQHDVTLRMYEGHPEDVHYGPDDEPA